MKNWVMSMLVARKLAVNFHLIFGCALTLWISSASAQDSQIRKKLIESGWDAPDSHRFSNFLPEIDGRPFDGAVLEIAGTDLKQRAVAMTWAFSSVPWQLEWFRSPVSRLQFCKPRNVTDNFLMLTANPGDIDWFDDAGWSQIVQHWRIAARVARESGMKGILFDPEPYVPPHAQFTYAAQNGHERHTFGEYCAQVRLRGRQIMEAIAAENPQCVVFCYFLNSVAGQAAGQPDAARVLETHSYGLLPAFLDGWLDVIPPGITLVDGCEIAYGFRTPAEYYEAASAIRVDCQSLVSPANRAKYRAQVQVSFGVYLDAYSEPPGFPAYIGGRGDGITRPGRMFENLYAAIRVADEYVWIRGEKHRWWPTPNRQVEKTYWPEVIPGCDQLLQLARRPVEESRAVLDRWAKDPRRVNLIKNGGFQADAPTTKPSSSGLPNSAPLNWGLWQAEESHGNYGLDRTEGRRSPGSARVEGMKKGCFTQIVSVQPGEAYVVAAAVRQAGQGTASVRVRWYNADRKWTAESRDVTLSAAASTDWQILSGVTQVPGPAQHMVLLLLVEGQETTKDIAWFDDVAVYRVE